MSSPTSVRNRNLGDEGLGGIDIGLGDALAEASDLANLLEEKHLSRLVAIYTDSSRIVATIFLTGEPVAEDLTDRLPILRNQKLAAAIMGPRRSPKHECRGRPIPALVWNHELRNKFCLYRNQPLIHLPDGSGLCGIRKRHDAYDRAAYTRRI